MLWGLGVKFVAGTGFRVIGTTESEAVGKFQGLGFLDSERRLEEPQKLL